MRRKIINLTKYVYILATIFFTIYVIWTQYTSQIARVLESIYYWWILVGLVLLIRVRKLGSSTVLKYSLFTFLLSVFLTLFNTDFIAEFIASVGFVGFMVGVVLVLLETRKENANS